ncbi:hypothetical protein GJ633_15135 [Halorubrum sp. CBA1125]|uniref:DUF7551 domain-containing protein n=1 Tax=Halorubrum sp. CBA1125 TaxID=2668072 RepID=UPI00135D1A6A|nr:hypothetical protein [Halorubrum sp. CBA1125]MUW15803.1 hypothetical protein [Halorubrum sp. CBA1125]
MIGTTLLDISDHIESLASETGEYTLVCARYGDRPVPAAGLRFESRPTARAAARATEQYRAALRQYDPQVPFYDVIVRHEHAADRAETDGAPDAGTTDGSHDVRRFSPDDAARWTLSDPVVGSGDDRSGADSHRVRDRDCNRDRNHDRDRVQFCHDAAAAVFEALSAADHDAVESAVIRAYFTLAERIGDPDDLCVCLLEATASELDRRLAPPEQAAVLADAAARLPEATSDDPIAGALDRLAAVGVLDRYTRRPGTATTVRVSGYALTPRDGRLPTLPVVLELFRRTLPADRPDTVRVAPVDDGWRLRLASAAGDPGGLASAAIRR